MEIKKSKSQKVKKLRKEDIKNGHQVLFHDQEIMTIIK